jgi:hypothetical protein
MAQRRSDAASEPTVILAGNGLGVASAPSKKETPA